jgi:predicted AlkP superfamily pyrophosphatase or phosphodiesterase
MLPKFKHKKFFFQIFTILLLLAVKSKIAKCEKNYHRTLIISFDGLQCGKFDQFLRNKQNSNFSAIINSGVRAKYMYPSFPSATFPNHFSIITGIN